MQLDKTSFIEISKRTKKKIVLFGSGNISKKTIRKLGKESIAFIVDNSENLQNTTYEELEVKSPNEISKDNYVLICSTAIREIAHQLEGLGLIANKDFAISPILNDLLAIQELENLDKTFYFTSGSVPENEPLAGGGFYKCAVDGLNIEVSKVYSGPCYGAIKVENEIYFVDTDKGIYAYSSNGDIEHKCKLPKGSRAHGISFNKDNQKFYVTCSYLDAVLEIDSKSFEILREFKLSDKIDRTKEPMHHCNDNWAIDNSLFVSMFSSTGQWKLDSFDGCIAEFDIETGERLGDVYSDLYMPHNIMVLEGSLHVLDSLPGHLRFSNWSIQGTFPAFTRGLAYSHGLYFIGQSKNRNYSKVMGMSNNVSIDCGIIAFNPELKASRFIQFPYTIGEIHSIVLIN
jgi:hypothetical protein